MEKGEEEPPDTPHQSNGMDVGINLLAILVTDIAQFHQGKVVGFQHESTDTVDEWELGFGMM